MNLKKIIITGATGMLGANLARLALEKGCEVLCVIRSDSLKLCNLPTNKNLSIIYSDISEYDSVQAYGIWDVFYHFAWDKTYGMGRDDVDSQLNNIKYTIEAARLAKRFGCTVFIGAGSQAEYGPVQENLTTNTPIMPQSGYGIAKYTAGRLVSLLCGQLGMRCNWVRVLSVFGPEDNYNTLIMYAIDSILNGESPALTKCEQLWDYLSARDAANAFFLIGQSGKADRIYLLGSGKGLPLSKYLEIIRDEINPNLSLNFGAKEYFPGQPMHLVADISTLIEDTGWKPEVSFVDGIKEIIANKKKSITAGEKV